MKRRELLKACGALLSVAVFDKALGLQWFSPELFGAEARMPIFDVNGEPLKVSLSKSTPLSFSFIPTKEHQLT